MNRLVRSCRRRLPLRKMAYWRNGKKAKHKGKARPRRRANGAALAAGAQVLKRGGVGYYRASNFVHLDTGAFRTWRG